MGRVVFAIRMTRIAGGCLPGSVSVETGVLAEAVEGRRCCPRGLLFNSTPLANAGGESPA